MAKRYIAIIIALLTVSFSVTAMAKEPTIWNAFVEYDYIDKSGNIQKYTSASSDDFSSIDIPLFQIRGNVGQRNDGWVYACFTRIDFNDYTEQYGVEVSYNNPVTFNGGLQHIDGAYNTIDITLITGNGEQKYYIKRGNPDSLGNVSVFTLGEYGTLELSDEMVLNVIKGTSVNTIIIGVHFFCPITQEEIIPMSKWTDGSLVFTDMSSTEEVIKRIEGKLDDITVQQAEVVKQNQTIIENITNGFENIGNDIESAASDIVDEISGKGGGENIGSAQEKMDENFAVLEDLENDLVANIEDKIEVPSLSLSSDESSGLEWVITTINSLYLQFGELHVMFACVVFFGIIAVLLFGRRNL